MELRFRNIYNIELGKASRGWVCDFAFRVQTRRQCTMEDHVVRGHGRQHWRGYGNGFSVVRDLAGIASALWNTWRESKRFARELQALPGDWNLDGTPRRA